VGQPVQDVQVLALPQGAPEIQVLLGFWHDDQRLPVDQPAAQDGQQRMRGPVIGSGGPSVPEAHARRTTTPPKLDGVLDDAAWQGAAPLTLVDSLDGRPAPFRTTARLAWDDEALYVAFDCEDPDVWGTFSKRDEPLYTEEVVEIFLDADADGRTYDEIEVSPHNVAFDAYFPARRQGMDLSWDSGLRSAVKVSGTLDDVSSRDRGWTVEMRIPSPVCTRCRTYRRARATAGGSTCTGSSSPTGSALRGRRCRRSSSATSTPSTDSPG
jgi:hypothetical protein